MHFLNIHLRQLYIIKICTARFCEDLYCDFFTCAIWYSFVYGTEWSFSDHFVHEDFISIYLLYWRHIFYLWCIYFIYQLWLRKPIESKLSNQVYYSQMSRKKWKIRVHPYSIVYVFYPYLKLISFSSGWVRRLWWNHLYL